MSYCRFGWDSSDVYVYDDVNHGLMCCGCTLQKTSFSCGTDILQMVAHLAKHKRAGHFVPFHAIEGLWSELPGPNKARRREKKVFREAKAMMRVAERLGNADWQAEYCHL